MPPAIPLRSLGRRTFLLFTIACAAYFIYLICAVGAARHLYSDGSWGFLKILADGHIFNPDITSWRDFFGWRIGAGVCHDLPLLLASWLGIAHLRVLSVIFGVTLFSFKPLGLLLCYRFARDKRYIVFPLFSVFAISINSEGYIVTETHLFTALFWAALFGLLFCNPLRGFDRIALAAVSAPLILCYEAMALFGLILCGACIYRMIALRERWLPAILGLWYFAGAILAALSVVYPRDVSNRSGFLRSLLFVIYNDHIGARVSCVVLLLAAIVLLMPSSKRQLLRDVTGVAVLCTVVIPAYILLFPDATSLNVQMMARTMNVTAGAVLTLAFLAVRFQWIAIDTAKFQCLFAMAAALGIAQSLWHIQATRQWNHMLQVLREDLAGHRGPIPFERSRMAQWVVDGQPIRNMHADWPLLALSIAESPGGRVQSIVLSPEGAFRPFDPLSPKSLPDLRRFGIDYQPYIAALPVAGHYQLGEWIGFNITGRGYDFKGKGWWDAEQWANWASADAEVKIRVPDAPPSGLVLETWSGAFIVDKHPAVDVDVLVNDKPVGTWHFALPVAQPCELHTMKIPGDVSSIRFRTADARSPQELGISADPRKLGFALCRMRLVAP